MILLYILSIFFTEKYLDYFTTPYFIFFRDTLSYLTLLGLHFAICLSPSTLAFSRIEWVVLVFFLGRIVTEFDQFMGNTKAGSKGRQSRERSHYGSKYKVCTPVDQQSTATSSDENAGLKRFANYFRYVWQLASVYKCWFNIQLIILLLVDPPDNIKNAASLCIWPILINFLKGRVQCASRAIRMALIWMRC